MTVATLIERLRQFPTTHAVVTGIDGFYLEIDGLSLAEITDVESGETETAVELLRQDQ